MDDRAMQKVIDLENRLYGNGQPGDIQRLEAREAKTEERVKTLEDFKWKLIFGGVMVALFTGDGVISIKALLAMLAKAGG